MSCFALESRFAMLDIELGRQGAGMRLLFILAVTLMIQPALADTLRCGSVLIEVGADASYVLAKCGEPTSKTIIAEPIWAGGVYGGAHQVGTSQTQIWRYDRGPRQFPAVMKIADGVVQSIEFEKNPGSPRD